MKMSVNKNSNNLLKFIISGIVLALCACQTMKPQPRTERIQNPQILTQENSQISTQEDSQVPDRDNPRNSGQSAIIGTWQGIGSLPQNGRFVAKINFQPNGTFQQEMTIASGSNSGTTMIYGSYRQNSQNSVVTLPDRSCVEGQCLPYTRSVEFTIVNSTELSSDGTKLRKISD